MKLGKLLIIASLLIGSTAFAQDSEDKECTRLIGVANNAMSAENYPEAVEYFLKAESYCKDIGKDNYNRMLACIQQLMDTYETDSKEYNQYLDTLMVYWDKSEKIGHYNQSDDVIRGYYYTLQNPADYVKADFYFTRGIKNQGMKLDDEVYIVLYYYNIYTLWYMEQDEAKKAELKQRYIKEYFDMSKLIKDANYSPKTQETLTQYLAQVITSCDDLTPEIPAFMSTLPEDAESKKTALLNMATLLEDNECIKEEGYKTIVDALYELDPNDPAIIEKVINTAETAAERIAAYKKLLSSTTSDEEKNRYVYLIAAEYFNMGSYTTAYNKAAGVTGEYRGKALILQGKSVAATANSCGDSTFDRKCNYLYAIQLLERAQSAGEGGLSGTIANYKSLAPDADDCFNNNSPKSVMLKCWNVTVNPCP